MTDSASYPDPFATPASTCVVPPRLTEGPCTEAADRERRDISEGSAGLPVRLSLRVVDGVCNRIPNATVKIWHTLVNGSYSGNTPNDAFCVKSPADGAVHAFRGVQTTDDDGRVDFDTCFPGWYAGRAIHIHFTVNAGGKTFTSQLLFDDALVAEIFGAHPDYTPFGQPDTTNQTDGIATGDVAELTLKVARMPDGAMQASKQLVCSI